MGRPRNGNPLKEIISETVLRDGGSSPEEVAARVVREHPEVLKSATKESIRRDAARIFKAVERSALLGEVLASPIPRRCVLGHPGARNFRSHRVKRGRVH